VPEALVNIAKVRSLDKKFFRIGEILIYLGAVSMEKSTQGSVCPQVSPIECDCSQSFLQIPFGYQTLAVNLVIDDVESNLLELVLPTVLVMVERDKNRWV
jgi:hypothetical protein